MLETHSEAREMVSILIKELTNKRSIMAVVLYEEGNYIITAEGNVNNISGIFKRQKSEYVNGYIRITDNYKYISD